MNDRRDFLRLAAFGAVAVGVPRLAHAGTPTTAADLSEADDGGGPWWLVAPLGPGGPIGLGWSIVRLWPAVEGAITVNLVHEDGRAARVDLSLREGAPRGPAATGLIDFIVMDGGNGESPMDESLGRALTRLAAIVGDNESSDLAALAALDPHGLRVAAHPDSMRVASARLTPGHA